MGISAKTLWIPVVFFVILTYVHFSHRSYARYKVAKGEPCHRNQTNLVENFRRTHAILNELKLHHFLVYGSLWGALRIGGPLPWDHDFDLGLFHSEVAAISQKHLYDAFRRQGLELVYIWNTDSYRVHYQDTMGDLPLFKEFHKSGWFERTGIETYVFFLHYAGYHTFPASLVSDPDSLPTVTFAGCKVAVPRGGMTIQKYHYPDDWWKVAKPEGCS